MQTTCLIDHSLEGTIPRFLCRACHPELNVSAATRAKLDAEDRGARPRAVAEEVTSQVRSNQVRSNPLKLQRDGARGPDEHFAQCDEQIE